MAVTTATVTKYTSDAAPSWRIVIGAQSGKLYSFRYSSGITTAVDNILETPGDLSQTIARILSEYGAAAIDKDYPVGRIVSRNGLSTQLNDIDFDLIEQQIPIADMLQKFGLFNLVERAFSENKINPVQIENILDHHNSKLLAEPEDIKNVILSMVGNGRMNPAQATQIRQRILGG